VGLVETDELPRPGRAARQAVRHDLWVREEALEGTGVLVEVGVTLPRRLCHRERVGAIDQKRPDVACETVRSRIGRITQIGVNLR